MRESAREITRIRERGERELDVREREPELEREGKRESQNQSERESAKERTSHK